jgi:hypothetical protein
MDGDSDVLLKLYEESWSSIRHYEEQRAKITNFVIVVASVAAGFVVQQKLTIYMFPIAILVVILGVYGALVGSKLYERTQACVAYADTYFTRLSELHPNIGMVQLSNKARAEHKLGFPLMSRIHLHHLWFVLNILIALTGVVLAVEIIFQ